MDVDGEDAEYACEIKKFTMDDWQKGYADPEGAPRPIIKVYYRSVSTVQPVEGSEHVGRAQSSSNKERPQRILINNPTLLDELEEASQIGLENLPTM